MITQDDVIYMIVTDRFDTGDPEKRAKYDHTDIDVRHGGDLAGVIKRLPYLADLGVTALWVTPIYRNPPHGYHGYHTLDFETVDPNLCSPELGECGDPAVMTKFVEIVHASGRKVIFDAIVSHTAKGHPWLEERPEWFNEDSDDPVKWWIWGLPDLNHDNVDVNLYFADNVLRWIERTHVDAVRVDATRHVETRFWHIFKLFTKGPYRGVTLIGEVWDSAVSVVAPYQTRDGFDSMFDYPLYHAIVDVFVEDQGFWRIARSELSEDEPYGVLNLDLLYRNAYHLVTFLDNHDTPRFLHLAGEGKRTAEAVGRTKLAMTFLFTTRGIPQVYYGSELGMEGGIPPENRRDMPWHLADSPDPSCPDAAIARDLHDFTRRLIVLRRSSTALRYGLLITLFVSQTMYAFARIFTDDVRIVVLNNGTEDESLSIPLASNPRMPSLAKLHLADGGDLLDDLHGGSRTRIENGGVVVEIPARSGCVYRVDAGADGVHIV